MGDPGDQLAGERVLVLAPTAKDAAFCRAILAEAGVGCAVCPDLASLCRELEAGAGAAVLTEEALGRAEFDQLVEAVGRQPAWSDFPVLVLTRAGADSEVVLQTLETLGNVTLLERPVRVPALVSAVRTALRARRRQYQLRDHLAEQQRAAEALRRADRQKDEFLAMLAHELRNPLAPIRNGLLLLDGPESGRVREMMGRQVDHLVRLVDDLLDVSRILRGKVELRVEPLDLATVLARATETSQPIIDAQGHELTVSLSQPRIRVNGDPVRLAQVFANLLNNAAKYTEKGGHIWVAAGREGGEVVVRVADDGIGMPADLVPRVFDLFTQAERSLDRSQGGLGLGLTLIKRLVEMHGGTVEAHSEGPGKGSEFVVRLPAFEGVVPGEPGPAGDTPSPPPAPPRRVLVVDDNADAAETLAWLLRAAGHDVLTAYDGRAAVDTAPAFRPEVVLLDIGLPGIDGYEVAARLRRRPELREALLVAVTGYGQDEDRRRSREAGFDEHLTKPIDPAALPALLARAGAPTG
jgi:signal transduction histidine kinase